MSKTAATRPGQTKVLLWIGFGGLLLLMLLMGISAVSFLRQAEVRQRRIQREYVTRDQMLEQVRSATYLTGTYVRDYLLDPSKPPSPEHQAKFREMERQIRADFGRMAAPPNVSGQVTEYLRVAGSVFSWPDGERTRRSYEFMQTELLPRRMQLLASFDGLRGLSERNLEQDNQSLSSLLSTFRLWIGGLAILSALVGSMLAGFTLRRILRLEAEANTRLEEAKRAGEKLAGLSAELVEAQENERRNISRELHDQVGQTLYAALLSLGNLRSSLGANQIAEGLRELQLAQALTERTASVVRNIALLLRPAMLDDLGLLPALKWLAREATRTQSIPVEVSAGGIPEDLPDDQITCVYRIVQESIYNAQRHSRATTIRVGLGMEESDGARSFVTRICDDGCGFEPSTESGLGILGMRERAGHLGGSLTIESAPGQSTAVVLRLPAGEFRPRG